MRQEFDKDAFVSMVKSGDLESAKVAIMNVYEYHAAEQAVFAAFKAAQAELVEVALKKFMGTHEACNMTPYHGYWVHSLSHFTDKLWERRMTDWIKRFNEVAFSGANELGDDNCSDRLVGDFGQHAQWDDDPAAFHLTPENLVWMDWKYFGDTKARIEASPFPSEEAFLRWRLRNEKQDKFDSGTQCEMVDTESIHATIGRIKELGGDTSEFDGFERELLTKKLADLEAKLATSQNDFYSNNLKKGIEQTKALLASTATA